MPPTHRPNTARRRDRAPRPAPRLAGAGRDRRPVPGRPAAEAGLAPGHARPGRRAPRHPAPSAKRRSSRPGRRWTPTPATAGRRDYVPGDRDAGCAPSCATSPGWGNLLRWGAEADRGITAASPDRQVTVVPQAALGRCDRASALLVMLVDPSRAACAMPATDGWAASADRPDGGAAAGASGIPIGLVTDGRWWALVCAREGDMVASGIVDALTWAEEPRTRDAFRTLLSSAATSSAATPRTACRSCSRSRSPPPRRSPRPSACRSAAPSSCWSRRSPRPRRGPRPRTTRPAAGRPRTRSTTARSRS